MKYLNTILILIILIMGAFIYYKSTFSPFVETKTITKIDTLYIEKEAIIDTVWYTETKIDTTFIETILQGETIIITHTDTIFVKEKDIIASIDTVFVSDDKMVKSNLSIKYSYNNQSFFIKNILSHKYMAQNTPIERRFPLGGIIYASGNKNSLSLGFGLSYKVSKYSNVFIGYDTSDRIMIGFGVSLP